MLEFRVGRHYTVDVVVATGARPSNTTGTKNNSKGSPAAAPPALCDELGRLLESTIVPRMFGRQVEYGAYERRRDKRKRDVKKQQQQQPPPQRDGGDRGIARLSRLLPPPDLLGPGGVPFHPVQQQQEKGGGASREAGEKGGIGGVAIQSKQKKTKRKRAAATTTKKQLAQLEREHLFSCEQEEQKTRRNRVNYHYAYGEAVKVVYKLEGAGGDRDKEYYNTIMNSGNNNTKKRRKTAYDTFLYRSNSSSYDKNGEGNFVGLKKLGRVVVWCYPYHRKIDVGDNDGDDAAVREESDDPGSDSERGFSEEGVIVRPEFVPFADDLSRHRSHPVATTAKTSSSK